MQLGVLPTDEARKIAWERGLDLVEVSPNAAPPVCKIMDYGKYKYAEHKKLQQTKRKQHRVQIKEIRLRPLTEEHDIQVKLNHIKGFIKKGDKVVITMVFKGREMAHRDIGYALLNRLTKETEEIAKVDNPITRLGSRFSLSLVPKK